MLTSNAVWKDVETVQTSEKLRQRYAPVGRLYSEVSSNFSKIFSFGILYPYRCTSGDEIWHGGVELWTTPPYEISPASVQRVAPAGR